MSTVTPLVTEPPAASRAGADLRAARERLGLSLEDVALDLRIRLPHLEALEEGQVSSLPGTAYALAFVRTYANALGLDAEEMVRRFRTEAAEFGRRTELVFPLPMPERGLPAGAVVLLGLVLAVGAYAGWYRLSGEGRLPAETVMAVPERLAPLAEQAVPPASGILALGGAAPGTKAYSATALGASAPASGVQAAGPAAEASGATAPAVAPGDQTSSAMVANPAPPVAAISPTSAAAAQLPPTSADVSAVAGLPPPASSVTVPPGAAPPAAAADASRLVLHASADAWVMVKDRAGAVLLNRTLKAGETWPVPPRPDLLLTVGNAGGTDILLDGAATSSLGPSGAVRRDLPLDPDQIKEGRLAAALAPQLASTRPRQ
jgi:cytoskeleton protein RodZ